MSDSAIRPAALIAMAALAGISLVLVAWVRWAAPSERAAIDGILADRVAATATGVSSAVPVALRFIDLPDGAVGVDRMSDGRRIAELAVGEGGFVRATLRSLARERPRSEGPQPERQSFLLQHTPQGQLWLIDPVSGRRLDLKAYGESNRRAFADLLLASERTP
ncbi:MAG: photosynthetic complex assembly protein PuhC [Betaproteobacteria bacterium]|nr:photosynthetic complex assembly protein PuhC [Betaproteobacteria bacterium]